MAPSWDRRSAIANIIIACTVVFLANMVFTYDRNTINDFLTLHATDLWRPWMWWRTLGYGFAHSRELTHIVFNMLGLWMLGRSVEERYGRSEFYRIYLLAVVLCGVVWLLLRAALNESRVSVCGASGAVCCIEMLFVLNYPRATLMLFGVLPIQAWVFGLIFYYRERHDGYSRDRFQYRLGRPLDRNRLAFAYFYGNWNLAHWIPSISAWRIWKRKLFGPKLRTFQGIEWKSTKPKPIVSSTKSIDLVKIH